MIKSFSGQYSFLSNFAFCDNLIVGGMNWITSEHAYQAMKTNDYSGRIIIQNCDTPGQAKRAGQKLTIVNNWDRKKVGVMNYIVAIKFNTNAYFKELLLLTGDEIIMEGNNWHDNFWGNCECPKCKNIDGLNHLGKILMDVRVI